MGTNIFDLVTLTEESILRFEYFDPVIKFK